MSLITIILDHHTDIDPYGYLGPFMPLQVNLKEIEGEYSRVYSLIQSQEKPSAGLRPKTQHWVDFASEYRPRKHQAKAGQPFSQLGESCVFKKTCKQQGDTTTTMKQWGQTEVKGLCAESKEAMSSIRSYDSNGNRFFQIDNAMLNFKKMHTLPNKVSWEQGFISANCGDYGKEDIGLPLYTPDIADQQCDYTLNETVVVYSLQSALLRDALTIHAMLELGGALAEIDKITLLHIRSLRSKPSSSHSDMRQDKALSNIYSNLFGRVLREADFPSARVCVKRVLWINKPIFLFPFRGQPKAEKAVTSSASSTSSTTQSSSASESSGLRCAATNSFGGSYFQSWNALMRRYFGLLPFVGPPRSGSATGVTKSGTRSGGELSSSLPVLTDTHLHVLIALPSRGPLLMLFLEYKKAVEASLQQTAATAHRYVVSVADISYPAHSTHPVYAAGNASIIITPPSSNSDSIFSAAFMPLGSKFCCGVLEIGKETGYGASFAEQAQYMGYEYARTSSATQSVTAALGGMVKTLLQQPSLKCKT